MTKRECVRALGLGTAVDLGGMALLFYKTFWFPFQELDASIVTLQQDVETKEERVRKIEEAKGRLERWRQLSLPSEIDFSRREYEIYLSDLLRQSGFTPGFTIMPKAPEKSSQVIAGKGPVYLRLPYTVQARGSLANLVH